MFSKRKKLTEIPYDKGGKTPVIRSSMVCSSRPMAHRFSTLMTRMAPREKTVSTPLFKFAPPLRRIWRASIKYFLSTENAILFLW